MPPKRKAEGSARPRPKRGRQTYVAAAQAQELLAELPIQVALRGPAAYAVVRPETAALLQAAGVGFGTQLAPHAVAVAGAPADPEATVLQAGLEEILFLRSQGCPLHACEEDGSVHTTLEGLWTYSLHHRPDLAHMYVAYHHLRAEGLLVRSGLQYGADFITYSDHPSRVHAEFCVLVQPTQQPSRLSWEDLEIVNRLSHQVAKSLRLVCVHDPQPDCGVNHPDCLGRFQVGQRLVARWVPAHVHAGGKVQ